MGERSPGSSASGRRLDSWKEIAAYLNRDVTTVQRWEKREGMPVHRHLHDRMGSVYAFRAELDEWTCSRSRAIQDNGSAGTSPVAPAVPAPSVQPQRARITWKFVSALAVGGIALPLGIGFWLQRTEYFWRNPLAGARFQMITSFDGVAPGVAISRDGNLIAFLSSQNGPMDVWVTHAGSGQFHNLTRGSATDIFMSDLRTPGFSPDGALVTWWDRKKPESAGHGISVWGVPTLGGQPAPYLDGAAEFDWSSDGLRLVYHTPGPGDPMFVSDGSRHPGDRPIFTAPPGLHCHFPLWAPDGSFIYFVLGSFPDKLDIWRISPRGGTPERITTHNARLTHPVFVDQRTLLYLASDSDGSGPWLYSVDVERRRSHRLNSGVDRYTSLAASADGHRMVATQATARRTLWRLPIPDLYDDGSHASASIPARIAVETSAGFSPRLGSNYLLYVSDDRSSESIWKFANGLGSRLWSAEDAQVFGGPAISPDGQRIAFSVRQRDQKVLYVMQADGTNARIVTDKLDLQGSPSWSPDGRSLTSAVDNHGAPQLFRLPVDGRSPARFIQEYSLDPAWSPNGQFLLYSGPDIGTMFQVKAVTPEAAVHSLPPLTLTRGARRLVLLENGRKLAFLQGGLHHKDIWLMDLETGSRQQLTHLATDFDVRDFDASPDGREVVLERLEERSDVVLLDLPR